MIKYPPEHDAILETTIIKLKSPGMIEKDILTTVFRNNISKKCLKRNDSFSMCLEAQRTDSYIKKWAKSAADNLDTKSNFP